MNVLDKGWVELEDHMGGDLAVVNAARVSFAQSSDELDDAGCGLIRFLMTNGHGTPFEHAVFKFRVKAPIFVAREWMRHRIGSYNEWSGRYSEITTEFYVPSYVRTQVGKPGAYTFEALPEDEANLARARMESLYGAAADTYHALLRDGVAKELASRVLPLATYTRFVWTANARSLMNFIRLRNAPDAQYEIREYARAIEAHFAEAMPVTAAAFDAAGRRSP